MSVDTLLKLEYGGRSYHLVVMLCRESGLEREKAMRMTCA